MIEFKIIITECLWCIVDSLFDIEIRTILVIAIKELSNR